MQSTCTSIFTPFQQIITKYKQPKNRCNPHTPPFSHHFILASSHELLSFFFSHWYSFWICCGSCVRVFFFKQKQKVPTIQNRRFALIQVRLRQQNGCHSKNISPFRICCNTMTNLVMWFVSTLPSSRTAINLQMMVITRQTISANFTLIVRLSPQELILCGNQERNCCTTHLMEFKNYEKKN